MDADRTDGTRRVPVSIGSQTTQEALLATVWRRGGRVFVVGLGEVIEDDPDDPDRTFVRQVMGAAAKLERSLIVKRMADGKRCGVAG